jgi:hypothetical protein
LEICDAMKHLYCQGSDEDIFSIKMESLKKTPNLTVVSDYR